MKTIRQLIINTKCQKHAWFWFDRLVLETQESKCISEEQK